MKYLLPFVLICCLCSVSQAQVAINEFMSSNSRTIADGDGDYEDWVELYNYSDEPVNLNGYGLSDSYNNPYRWVFPEIILEPGEFLLIWASGKKRSDPDWELHTNFAISSEGEELLLTDIDGNRIDEWDPVPLPSDISLGRYPDGIGEAFYFDQPTPGEPNSPAGVQTVLESPKFSIKPGFYDHSVTLEIMHHDPDAVIYYTTDGSVPDSSSCRYTGPVELSSRDEDSNRVSMIRPTPPEAPARYSWNKPEALIDKAHIIRAVALKTNSIPSPVNTGTWFVNVNPYSLPVISIVAPDSSFFGNEEGIYVPGAIYDSLGFGSDVWGRFNANYFQRGREWEREASFEWFENETQIFQQNIGVRIHGAGSRALPMKSLRLYARGTYGPTYFRHPVFPDLPWSEYKRFILRNSGQDFFNKTTMFRDAFMQQLIRDLNVRTQAYRPSIVFLNGEYWGIHNIRERYDKYFFERVYDVPENQLDYLEGHHQIKEGKNDDYLEMVAFIEENGLEDPDNLEEVSNRMDLDNYTDYIILNIFFRNSDWPGSNIDYWRYSGPPDANIPEKDGRWRWLVFDLDFGFGLNERDGTFDRDMIAFVTDPEGQGYANRPWATFLIRSLFENEEYRQKFLRRFNDLLNTTFRSNEMNALINEMAAVIRPEMGRHIERWSYPDDINAWEENINLMKEFAIRRPAHQIDHLKEHFDTGDMHPVEINWQESGAGAIRLNSLEINPLEQGRDFQESFQWRGNYFSNIPIEVEALPSAGYTFSHWEVNGDSISGNSITIELPTGTNIHPVFTFVDDYDGVVPEAFPLKESSEYMFEEWSPDEPDGSYPSNMVFVHMDDAEPGLDAPIAGFTTGSYDLESRTRINGLGADGFSFINTDNLDGNPGYPGRCLGGALLALDTRDTEDITVTWTGGTVLPNSREYAIRLQYRIGDRGNFSDLLHPDGSPVEYVRNDSAGHSSEIGPVTLPVYLEDKPYVQLLWRYYHTGVRHYEDSGARSLLNISSIRIGTAQETGSDQDSEYPDEFRLLQNYPNPFNNVTTIPFSVPEESVVAITVYDITGRNISKLADDTFSAGTHYITFDSAALSSGVYLYRVQAGDFVKVRKMTLIK